MKARYAGYLTEEKLGNVLRSLYGKTKVIAQQRVGSSRLRFDFFLPDLNLAVEFDGFRHFSSFKTILADADKDRIAKSLGIKVIRIPYFVQLTSTVAKKLLKVNCVIETSYPHGFIDRKALLPYDFSPLGLARFKTALVVLPRSVQKAILDTCPDLTKFTYV